MVDDSVITQLKDILGESNVLRDKADLVTYSYDATPDLPSRMPDVIVLPATTAEVRNIVLIARTTAGHYPASGTNLSGGTIPLQAASSCRFREWTGSWTWTRNLTATVQRRGHPGPQRRRGAVRADVSPRSGTGRRRPWGDPSRNAREGCGG
jgi:glycolate oxidase